MAMIDRSFFCRCSNCLTPTETNPSFPLFPGAMTTTLVDANVPNNLGSGDAATLTSTETKDTLCSLPCVDKFKMDPFYARHRFDSESSNDSGFEGLEHLEPLDIDDLQPMSATDCRYQKRVSFDLSGCDELDDERLSKVTLFSVAVALKRKLNGKPAPLPLRPESRARQNWKKALALIRKPRADPWANFELNSLPAEKAIRHRYNAISKTWTLDEVVVKVDKKPFDKGAMRECFRMKKLSNFSHSQDWMRDSNNYVAKRYMSSEIERMTYFEDVKLQMDAKLWGEEFNRHNPPKKVDIFMMTVYEFIERENKPLFHVEHFIDGDYIKYNSNSGFVDNSFCRQTPQAFSHFTFERSGHELIVVDVQGVGDLYTDPQIHTADGTEYGDGNLGTKGMALFFHSHTCNRICKSLGLTRFDLTKAEKDTNSNPGSRTISTSMTVLRGSEIACEIDVERINRVDFLRNRSISGESGVHFPRSPLTRNISGDSESSDCPSPGLGMSPRERQMSESSISNSECRGPSKRRLRRYSTESETLEKDAISFQDLIKGKARPSSLRSEEMKNPDFNDSVLGQVHLQLAKYHEACRFTDDGVYDKDAAFFHLKAAADCNVVVALMALAQLYIGLPHDILTEVKPEQNLDEKTQLEIGLEYMERAASAGERSAMVFIAKAYDTGLNLPNPEMRSVSKALYWYESIDDLDDEEGDGSGLDWGMDDPPYLLLARQAEIWLNGEAGQKDADRAGTLFSKAAESATMCMKGKLATKYYMLAEEAWAACDD